MWVFTYRVGTFMYINIMQTNAYCCSHAQMSQRELTMMYKCIIIVSYRATDGRDGGEEPAVR